MLRSYVQSSNSLLKDHSDRYRTAAGIGATLDASLLTLHVETILLDYEEL